MKPTDIWMSELFACIGFEGSCLRKTACGAALFFGGLIR